MELSVILTVLLPQMNAMFPLPASVLQSEAEDLK